MYSSCISSKMMRSIFLISGLFLGFLGLWSASVSSAPLDTITSSRAATYSLRQLEASYTGQAVRVRRDSDNTETDIAFLTGELNTGSLNTFCGANSCFVTTWYDQSGNQKNATQITPSMQPRIVNAGVIDMSGNRPSLVFMGAQTLSANWGSGYTSYAHSAVYSRDSTTWPFGSVYHQGPSWSLGWIHAIEGNGPFNFGMNGENFVQTGGSGSASGDGMNSANSVPMSTVGVYTMNAPVGNISLYLNNTLEVSATRTGISPVVNNVRIGSWDGWETRYAYFHLSEMIFYSSALSDIERSTFTIDEKSYYGFDVTPPVVSLVGSGTQTIAHGSVFSDSGATWSDAVDGTGTIVIASSGSVNTATAGIYTLTYRKIDAAGNTGSMTRTVIVADQSSPVVTLIGSGTITLANGAVYTELGATWADNVDGTGIIMIAISGSVNTSIAAIYTLTYRKVDLAGNTGSTTRAVTVLAPVVVQSSGGGGGGTSSVNSYIPPVNQTASWRVQTITTPMTIVWEKPISQESFDVSKEVFGKSKKISSTTTLKNGTKIVVYRISLKGKEIQIGTTKVVGGNIKYTIPTKGKYIFVVK